MKRFVFVLCLVLVCGAATAELSVPEFSNRTLNIEVEDDAFSDYLVVNAEDPQNTVDEVSENASGSTHVTNRSVADSSRDNRISADDIEVYSTDDADTLTLDSVLENGSAEVSGSFDQNDSINYTAGKTVNLTEQSPGNFTRTVDIGEPGGSKALRVDSGDSLGFSYFNGSERVTNATVLDTKPPDFTGARQVSGREVVLEFSEDISGPSDDIGSESVEFPNLDSAVPTDVSVSASDGSFAARARLNTSISTGRQPLTDFASRLTDAAGNTATGAAVTASDRAPPQPTAIYSRDTDTDGRLDTVEITTSEQLESSASLNQVFSVSQGGDTLQIDQNELDGNQVTLGLTESKVWTGNVGIEYSPGGLNPLSDREGNEMNAFDRDSLDRAQPILVGAIINRSSSGSEETVIDLVFSEQVRSVAGTDSKVTVDGETQPVEVSDGQANTTVGGSLDMTSIHTASDVTGINDGRGNSVRSGGVRVRVFPNSSRTGERAEPVILDEGWNLVSLPIDTGSRVPVDDVFSNTSSVESIWGYADGEWSAGIPGSEATEVRHMRGGLGYAVEMSEATEFTPKLAAAGGAPSDIDAGQQWVLAGGTEPYRQQASETGAFSHLNGVEDVRRLENGEVDRSESIPGETEPGKGYWVEISGGTLTGSFRGSPSLGDLLGWLWP